MSDKQQAISTAISETKRGSDVMDEKSLSRAGDHAGDHTSYCCDEFAKQAGCLQALAGGGFMYPREMRPSAQFERGEDGSWNINGCCGGGCYVVSDMRYCPYCGAALTEGTRDE